MAATDFESRDSRLKTFSFRIRNPKSYITMQKKKYSIEELVQLHQAGKINWLQFVEMSDDADDYRQWCRDHLLTPDEKNAQVYLEQTEVMLTSGQIDPDDYEQLQKQELQLQEQEAV